MPGHHILFWWDTEDFINPESDDALLLLLKEFHRRSIPAAFKMVGEKVRVLRRRNRTDILDLLRDDLFEIGYHTDTHSLHPTIAEYTEPLDGPQAVAEVLRRETAGFEVTRDTFAKEVVCFGQPSVSYTPFAFAAMRTWGIPAYVGGSVYLGDDRYPTRLHGLFNMGGLWDAKMSYRVRTGEAAAATARRRVCEILEQLPADVVISHLNHPAEWSHEEWWDDINFHNGAMPDRSAWKRARAVPPAILRERIAQYGEYLDWIVGQGIEPIGVRQAMARFHDGHREIGREIVMRIANAWAGGAVDGELDEQAAISLSAAQALHLLARAVLEAGATEFAVTEVDAPNHLDGLRLDSGLQCTAENLKQAARMLTDYIDTNGRLPAAVDLQGVGKIPPAVLGVGLARHLLNPDAAEIEVRPGELRFVPDEKVKIYGKTIGPCAILPDNFTGENLRRYTCLLAWSYRRLLPLC